MLEKSDLVLVSVYLLIHSHLLLVVSLTRLHLHRKHLLLCSIHLRVLIRYHFVQTDDLRLQHLLLVRYSCNHWVLFIDLLLIEGEVGLESCELLSKVRERLLTLFHFLLEISVLASDRVEITVQLLDRSVFLVEVNRALLELAANTVVLLIELIYILLLGV